MAVRASKVTALPCGLGGLEPFPCGQIYSRTRSLAPSHTVTYPWLQAWREMGKQRGRRGEGRHETAGPRRAQWQGRCRLRGTVRVPSGFRGGREAGVQKPDSPREDTLLLPPSPGGSSLLECPGALLISINLMSFT